VFISVVRLVKQTACHTSSFEIRQTFGRLPSSISGLLRAELGMMIVSGTILASDHGAYGNRIHELRRSASVGSTLKFLGNALSALLLGSWLTQRPSVQGERPSKNGRSQLGGELLKVPAEESVRIRLRDASVV